MKHFIYDDGGRKEAGYRGDAGDCVVRAISIASGIFYASVYDDLFAAAKAYAKSHNNKVAKEILKYGGSPRNGVSKEIYHTYLLDLGFEWVPLSGIGKGCTAHVCKEELPSGHLILRLSKHMAAFINGVLHDTYDSSKNGTRCVYGYYKRISDDTMH